MRYHKILIDVSNLYYRAYHIGQYLTFKLEDGSEVVTGGVFNSLKMIDSIVKKFATPYAEVFFLFDNTYSFINRRKEIDPDYKANRDVNQNPTFYRGLDYLQDILLHYSNKFVVVKFPQVEADDLVKPLIESFKKDETVLLISNDLDWARAVSETTHWAPYRKKDYQIVDLETFTSELGYDPGGNAVHLYKTIRGDSSDNIPPGIPGIREEAVLRLVEHFRGRTVKDLIKEGPHLEFLSDAWKAKLRDKQVQGRLILNYQLVDYAPLSYKDIEDYVFTCRKTESVLQTWYKTLGFKSRIKSENPKKGDDFFQRRKIQRV